MTRIAPYKRKVRKLIFSNKETETSTEESAKQSKGKYKDSSESSDSNNHKRNISHMKKLLVNLKRLNRTCSMEKLKNEKKQKRGFLE